MAGVQSGTAFMEDTCLQKVFNCFKGLWEKSGNTGDKFTILEYKTNMPHEIRKFICGNQGSMWELWLHPDGEVSPPILEKDHIPYIAHVYYAWRTGGYSKGRQTTLIPSEHLDPKHGLLYWCDLYIEHRRETACYYEDGFFNAGGYLWFPEPKNLDGGRKCLPKQKTEETA